MDLITSTVSLAMAALAVVGPQPDSNSATGIPARTINWVSSGNSSVLTSGREPQGYLDCSFSADMVYKCVPGPLE